MAVGDTRTQLLDLAQRLVQERGFNAFSFKDLAKSVGIRTPSVHYHFETKSDLGEALMERYLAELDGQLAELSASSRGSKRKIAAFVDSYRQTEKDGLVCLCGSLASDVVSLPDAMRPLVEAYFERSEAWVAEQIRAAEKAGEVRPAGKPADLAALLVGGLQGALFVGRARGGVSMLNRVERAFWKLLEA